MLAELTLVGEESSSYVCRYRFKTINFQSPKLSLDSSPIPPISFQIGVIHSRAPFPHVAQEIRRAAAVVEVRFEIAKAAIVAKAELG